MFALLKMLEVQDCQIEWSYPTYTWYSEKISVRLWNWSSHNTDF